MGGYYHTEHARVTVEGGWLGLQDVPGLDWKCRGVHITSKPSKHHDLIRINNIPQLIVQPSSPETCRSITVWTLVGPLT
jgi:hypothetical protein